MIHARVLHFCNFNNVLSPKQNDMIPICVNKIYILRSKFCRKYFNKWAHFYWFEYKHEKYGHKDHHKVSKKMEIRHKRNFDQSMVKCESRINHIFFFDLQSTPCASTASTRSCAQHTQQTSLALARLHHHAQRHVRFEHFVDIVLTGRDRDGKQRPTHEHA